MLTNRENITEKVAICEQLMKMESLSEKHLETHINNLVKIQEDSDEMYRRTNRHLFKWTDIAPCPRCNANLIVRSGFLRNRRKKDGTYNKRKSSGFMIGCSNYNGTNPESCNYKAFPTRENNDEYDSIYDVEKRKITIEERNKWGKEKVRSTFLDKYTEMEEDNYSLLNEIQKKVDENKKLQRITEEQESKITKMNRELDRFKHLKGKTPHNILGVYIYF